MQELRRRVESDPASIAFAQLAEEYRRADCYDEAVTCCRTGLARHPGYLSARVTLGRALIELGQLDEAAGELEVVLRSAPDNLAAIRGMAEIHQRRGDLQSALDSYKRALTFARHDPELEDTVAHIARELGPVTPPSPATGLSFAEAHSELLSAGSRIPQAPDLVVAETVPEIAATAPEPLMDFDALLRSFGMPGATPPPLMEMLLAKSRPPRAPEPLLPQLPPSTTAHDAFEALERELREFDAPPADTPMPAAESSSAMILTELESWLAALRRDRRDHSESA